VILWSTGYQELQVEQSKVNKKCEGTMLQNFGKRKERKRKIKRNTRPPRAESTLAYRDWQAVTGYIVIIIKDAGCKVQVSRWDEAS